MSRRRNRAVGWTCWLVAGVLFLGGGEVGAETRGGRDVAYDVVYGERDGQPLEFDVLSPKGETNGAAVLYLASASWKAQLGSLEWFIWQFDALMNAGFKIMLVSHSTGPKVPALAADVRRAVRFVRLHAAEYGLDPNRLGIYGGSSGGHLALLVGLNGDDGDPTAGDAVERTAARVGAVVAFYPPVDLRERTAPNTEHPPAGSPATLFFANGTLRSKAVARYPALDFAPGLLAAYSPITLVSSDDPPTLLVHGTADPLVDPNCSRALHDALERSGVDTELVLIEGGTHGFWHPVHHRRSNEAMTRWFVEHLGRKGGP